MKMMRKLTRKAATWFVIIAMVSIVAFIPQGEAEGATFGALAKYDFEAGTDMQSSGIGTAPTIISDPERGNVLCFGDGATSEIITDTINTSIDEHNYYRIEEGSPSSLKFENPFKGKSLYGVTIAMWVKVPTMKAAGVADGEVDETLSAASGLVGFVDSQERGLVHPDAEYGGLSNQIYSGRTFFGINAQPGVYFRQIHANGMAAMDTDASLAYDTGTWKYLAVAITNDWVHIYVDGKEARGIEISLGKRFKSSDEHVNPGNDGMPYLLDFLSDDMTYRFGGVKGTHTFIDAHSKKEVTYGKIESDVSGYVGFTGFSGTQAGVCIDDLAFFNKAYSRYEMEALYEAAKTPDGIKVITETETEDENSIAITKTGLEINAKGVLKKYRGMDSDVQIPENVVSIGNGAFAGCSHLTSVTIPAGVTAIAENAFADCPNLTLYVEKGSYTEQYAIDHNIKYQLFSVFDASENPVLAKETMAELVEKNAEADIIIKTIYDVTFTFEKGSMKAVEGVEEYNFQTTPYGAIFPLPPSLEGKHFISAIHYNYSGKLPGKASIRIPVGIRAAGKTVCYALLNADYTLGARQNVVVDADGYITVTQEHCSISVVFAETAKLGDADGDGELTTDDALMVLKNAVGVEETLTKEIADMDGDGEITTDDALIVLKYAVGVLP